MKQVHYAILEDMQKYIKDFNPDDYEKTDGYTAPSVIRYLRNYYDNHLPVDITAWIRVNEADSDLIWGEELEKQVCFVRDKINFLLRSSYMDSINNEPSVISTHYSKAVKLPVFQINLEPYGLEIVLRYNFYDWKVSVKSKKALNFNFMHLFDTKKEIPYFYCEGFPMDKVYGSFEKNPAQFTVEIDSNYDLYTFFFLLKYYMGIKKDY